MNQPLLQWTVTYSGSLTHEEYTGFSVLRFWTIDWINTISPGNLHMHNTSVNIGSFYLTSSITV